MTGNAGQQPHWEKNLSEEEKKEMTFNADGKKHKEDEKSTRRTVGCLGFITEI